MKNLLLKLSGLSLLLSAILFVGCEEDPIITNPLGPDASFVADAGFVSADGQVEIGQNFSVRLRLVKGDAKLQSVQILAGTTKLENSRFSINAGAITSNNPFLVTGADQDGVTYDIAISPASGSAVGDVTLYKFEVTDANGETDAVDVQITIKAPPTTPLENTLTGVLFNQAGPSGTGGLDLDTGTGTGSSAAGSELRDLGIDCGLPNSSNWRKQIGTINGADMKKVDLSRLENFTFANVTNKEAIASAYSTGITLADDQSETCGGSVTPVTDVTSAVAVGDMFVVSANGKTYLIRIDEVNTTNSDNDDNYKLSIKF